MNLPMKRCSRCKNAMTELVYATMSGGAKPRKVWKPICTDCVVEELETRCFVQEDKTYDRKNMLQPMDRMIKTGEAIGISLKHVTFSIRNITSCVDRESTMLLVATQEYPEKVCVKGQRNPPHKTIRLKTYKGTECRPLFIMVDAGNMIREVCPCNQYPEGIGTPTSP